MINYYILYITNRYKNKVLATKIKSTGFPVFVHFEKICGKQPGKKKNLLYQFN